MLSLGAVVRRAAQINPEGRATVHEGRELCWRDFPERVARLAAGLRSLGVETGDRVAILSLNSDYYYEYYFATAWAGAVFVPINTRLAGPEIVHWLNDSGAKVLCVDAAFLDTVLGLRDQLPALETLVYLGADAPEGSVAWEALATETALDDAGRGGDDLAGLFYTGGTTGRSRGVMLSHQNLVVNALQISPHIGVQRDDRILHTAPMFHIADWVLCMSSVMFGGSNFFLPGFDPVEVMATIAEQRIQKLLLVPTMINMLVNHSSLPEYDLSSLQRIMYGASPMPQAVIAKVLEVMPAVEMVQAYGQTEAAPCVTMLAPQYHTVDADSPHAGKVKAAGQAVPGVEIAVLDEDDKPVPVGEVGEVCCRGPNVMLGYRNLPEQTEATLRNGWLHTGDGGRMDEDGFLYIVDRIKDMIVSGGENVYSAEVENALSSHPAVAQ
ncbi:MAG: AMP-binding protein, partial [Halieaceae bacterium]|nr:AMP-binding protein [Halieaceae bacterium]